MTRTSDVSNRTTVLLGAGASRDAGLLLTSDLAETVVKLANEQHTDRLSITPDWVRALNTVYGGMIGYQAGQGRNPLLAVNIETLISAIRLLRERDTHEVAPFVATWAPSLSNFGPSDIPAYNGQTIIDAVDSSIAPDRLGHARRRPHDARVVTEAIANIAQRAVSPNLTKPFEDAENFILSTLVDLLSNLRDIDYLDPILDLSQTQQNGLDVITLNYDLAIETAASKRGVDVNRGIERWIAGEPLHFEPKNGSLNLLKLHGSLDWRPSDTDSRIDDVISPRGVSIRPVSPVEPKTVRPKSELPWIVVGDREKLATDGPTLALNYAAREALLRSTHLAIIGYSFTDTHINTILRDWLAGDPGRTMSVLDTWWPKHDDERGDNHFKSALIENYATQFTRSGKQAVPRLNLVEGRAKDKLYDVLHSRPMAAPSPLVSFTITQVETAYEVDFVWHGEDLYSPVIVVNPGADPENLYADVTSASVYEDASLEKRADWTRPWPLAPRTSRWQTGKKKVFYIPLSTRFPIELRISGDSMVGSQFWNHKVEKPFQ